MEIFANIMFAFILLGAVFCVISRRISKKTTVLFDVLGIWIIIVSFGLLTVVWTFSELSKLF